MNINNEQKYKDLQDKVLLSEPNTIFINKDKFEKFTQNQKILKKIYVGG